MWQTLQTSKEFFAGNYQGALNLKKVGAAIAPSIEIGSLVFLGYVVEAEIALKRLKPSPEQLPICEYFLAVGYVRESRYDDAKKLFARIASTSRNSTDLIAKFFAINGIAFYRYYCGRYRQSLALAERAVAYAKEAQFSYGEIIATDIVANSAVSCGKVRKGLNAFKRALLIAETIDGSNFERALRVSHAVNESAFNSESATSIRKLNELKMRQITNTYSLAEINLEMIRQYTLIGQATKAQQLLDETYELVHKNSNRRQAATLNLRSAYLLYLAGDFHQALHLVRTAKNLLHPAVDRLAAAQLTGLEIEILTHLGDRDSLPQLLEKELADVTIQSAIHRRIVSRRHKKVGDERSGEDHLGDAMDRIIQFSGRVGTQEIFESGHLTLLRKPLQILPGSKLIVFGVVERETVLFDGAESKSFTGLSRNQREILVALNEGEKTKEELIQAIWKYDYHPERHDGLIYSAIKSLRKRLPSNWIELTDKGYRLGVQVEIRVFNSDPLPTAHPLKKPIATRAKVSKQIKTTTRSYIHRADLNLRQNKVLESLESGKRSGWTALDSRRLFSVSTMTATRDLTDLHEKRMLQRIGRGRATYYVLGSLS